MVTKFIAINIILAAEGINSTLIHNPFKIQLEMFILLILTFQSNDVTSLLLGTSAPPFCMQWRKTN